MSQGWESQRSQIRRNRMRKSPRSGMWIRQRKKNEVEYDDDIIL